MNRGMELRHFDGYGKQSVWLEGEGDWLSEKRYQRKEKGNDADNDGRRDGTEAMGHIDV